MVAQTSPAAPLFFLICGTNASFWPMTLTEIAVILERLGCPSEKSAAMASQLDRRARMDAERDGMPYEAALARLLGLMAQGWATPGYQPKKGE